MVWKNVKWPIYHLFVAALALLMLYPVLWMLFSSFKESRTIFVTAESLFPAGGSGATMWMAGKVRAEDRLWTTSPIHS